MSKPLPLANVDSKYGAPMGRREYLPDDQTAPVLFHLRRMRIDKDGCDHQGAYWGIGDAKIGYMYHAEGEYNEETHDFARLFVRARDRKHAQQLVRARLPNARFHLCPADIQQAKDEAWNQGYTDGIHHYGNHVDASDYPEQYRMGYECARDDLNYNNV